MPVMGRPLSLEEAFRTLGHELDKQGVARVVLTVDATGVTLERPAAAGRHPYLWPEIIRQGRAQRQARRSVTQTVTWLDAHAFTRWSLVLRLTGRLLDARAVPGCQVTATIGAVEPPRACEVQVCVDSSPLFGSHEVQRELLVLHAQQSTDRQRALATPRHWWAPWRSPARHPDA